MAEKISVITISFNSIKTIEKTFISVLTQSYRPLEYVLVDGGSTDGTIEYIEKYIPKFLSAGIEVNFKSEKDNGISDAFNKGICRATGDIIGIINSDDQLMENSLDKVAAEFKKSKVDVVCGDCLWVDEKHQLQYIRKSRMKLDRLKYEMVLMHPSCFVAKSAYEKYGLFDDNMRYAMDKELMARFYRCGATFSYISDVLVTMHAGGASDTNVSKVYQEGINIAVQNGVPRWYAILRSKYKAFVLIVISKIKSNKLLWNLIHKD